jgi:hypothetical protein
MLFSGNTNDVLAQKNTIARGTVLKGLNNMHTKRRHNYKNAPSN